MRLVVKLGVIAVAGCFALGSAAGEEGGAATCVQDREAFMAMDYWAFDQSPKGVRSVSERAECELEAADLIRDYHAMLRERGDPVTFEYEGSTITMGETGEVFILYWHEGQLRAFAGQTDQAAALFRKSLKPEDQNFQGWNQYALASIAFLEDDLASLTAQRGELAERVPADNINLGVVDELIACFGDSYSEAYGSDACNRRPGRSEAPG